VKKDKIKTAFLEQLTKVPIIQLACEKMGVARATVYRWRAEDQEFKKKMEDALKEGETMINDMSEAQVISLIKEKNWHAISFWLRHHHSKYVQRIEISTNTPQEELNPEQEAVVKEALRLSSMQLIEVKTEEKIIEPSVVQEKPVMENKPEKPKGPIRITEEEFSQLEGEITEPIIVETKRGETTYAPHGEKMTKFKSGGSAYSPPNPGYEPLLRPGIKKVGK
jgi:hypothetical protein